MSDIRPYLVENISAAGRPLSRVPQKSTDFAENWLQELLFLHPAILPIEALDEAFAPLVSIGREIAQIDNLFINSNGLLTLVETKLWRNPEAHRTVVAQILDYVNTLTTWSYEKLDQYVAAYYKRLNKPATNIYKLVKAATHGFDIDEIEFQSRVQDCLTNGRFALLVVGDKIFPEATQLADVIQSAPHLRYTFGFVELACYRIEKDTSWPLVVVPHFVAKTKEFTRAVVTVNYEGKKPEVLISTPEEKSTTKINSTVFIESLPSNIKEIFKNYLEKWISAGYTIHWGKVGFAVYLNWKGKLISLFDAYPDTARMIPEKSAKQYNLPAEVYAEYRDTLLKSSTLGSLIVSGRCYPNFNSLSKEDVVVILDATDKLYEKLHQIK